MDDQQSTAKGFSVEPINCPHVSQNLSEDLEKLYKVEGECKNCKDKSENWMCLKCGDIFCSRYVKGHFKEHNVASKHQIGISFSDLSFWCYECESYVKNSDLTTIYNKLHKLKFGVEPGVRGNIEEIASVRQTLKGIASANPAAHLESSSDEEMDEEDDSDDDTDFFSKLMPKKVKKQQANHYWFIQGLDEKLLENKAIDKILGCIYGNALGDAYGLSTEFQNRIEIKKTYGDNAIPFPDFKRNFHNCRWDMGDWTDDTDQMILIMETILEKNGEVDEKLFGRKLVHWVRHGFPELGDYAGMGLGATTAQIIHHDKFLVDPHKASEEVWIRLNRNAAPNGGVMRTSITGVFNYGDISKVLENTIRMCKVTHWDSRCVSSCVLVTYMIAKMIGGQSTESKDDVNKLIAEGVEVALKYLDEEHNETFMNHVLKDSTKETLDGLKLDESRAIGYTLKAMGAGLWALLSDRGYADTMNLLAREGGDADTNGAVAGALLGTKLGYSKLPRAWLSAMPNKDWLDKKVVQLLQLMKLI